MVPNPDRGTGRIGQLNLGQPFLAITWSALLLSEQITWAAVLACMAVCLTTGARVT